MQRLPDNSFRRLDGTVYVTRAIRHAEILISYRLRPRGARIRWLRYRCRSGGQDDRNSGRR